MWSNTLYKVSLRSFLCETISTIPWSFRYSAFWKSTGNSSLMVSCITLLPAKPFVAPCSAIVISPYIAKEAVTPRVVGSVRTTM